MRGTLCSGIICTITETNTVMSTDSDLCTAVNTLQSTHEYVFPRQMTIMCRELENVVNDIQYLHFKMDGVISCKI